MTTIANGSRAPAGRGTATARVWPAAIVTEPPSSGVVTVPSGPITEMLARAAADGAVSSKPTVTPRADGFPATTPCSVTGGTAVVNAPIPVPGTSTPATIGTFDVSRRPAAAAPSELSETGVAAPADASTGAEGNWGTGPAGVYATTFTCASVDPGTTTNSLAALLATVRPGITRVVAGGAACGSQAPPEAPPCHTEAATWPAVVCTCRASAWEPDMNGATFSVTNWPGATVMALLSPFC